MADYLDQWYWRNPLPQGNNLNAAAYGNGIYVAVGNVGTITYSADLNSWTVKTLVTSYNLLGLAFGHGIFIAVGENGIILTSPDADTWTLRSSGTTAVLTAVAYGNGRFVAVGYSGTILSSVNNGADWTPETSGTVENLNAVTYGITYWYDRFVAVGNSGVIRAWDAGSGWIPVSAGVPANFRGVAWGNGVFAITGNFNEVLTSTDLITFSGALTPYAFGLQGIFYGNGLFITVDDFGELYTSPNAFDWTMRSSFNNMIFGMTFSPSIFMLVGNAGTICSSVTGETWTQINSGNVYGLTDVVYNGNTFMAVGQIGTILASSDGSTWIERTSGTTDQFNGIAYGNGVFVAVNYNIYISSDGIIWTFIPVSPSTSLWGVAYGAGKFVTVGYNGRILTSTDGYTWTPRSSGITNELSGVSYCNDIFIAVSYNGDILTSPDGITWTSQISGYTSTLFRAAYGSGRYVVTGYDAILTSLNSTDWTTIPIATVSPIRGICYAFNTFVAVTAGDDILLTSSDGVEWTTRNSASQRGFTAVAANASSFVAVGYGGIIMQSSRADIPSISVNPALKDFGNAVVGGLSAEQVFTVTNTGFGILNIGTLFMDGPDQSQFILYDDCSGLHLASGETGQFTAVFGPASAGYKTAFVGIPSDDPTTPFLTVPLSGTGIAPVILVSPEEGNFGNVIVGTVSQPQEFTVRNIGPADLVISNITIQGVNASEFLKQNDNCTGQTIAPGTFRTFQTVFTPLSAGIKSASAVIVSNDPEAPSVSVSLAGIGQTHPSIIATPTFKDFGDIPAGISSLPQLFTITNGNSLLLTIGTITKGGTDPGDFVLQNDNCSGRTLNHGESGTFEVAFLPVLAGEKQAGINVPSNDPDFPILVIPVSGRGTSAIISVLPPEMDFGDITVGNTSLPQTFTVQNAGTADLVLGTVSITGTDAADFIKLNDQCSGKAFAPGMIGTLQVMFRPSSAGVKSGQINIPSNAADIPVFHVPLSGSGTVNVLTAEPPEKAFPPTVPGSTPVYQRFIITNRARYPITIGKVFLSEEQLPAAFRMDSAGMETGFSSTAADFAAPAAKQGSDLRAGDAEQFSLRNDQLSGRTLQPNESATIEAAFIPTRPGIFFASINVPTNDPLLPLLRIRLGGTAPVGARVAVSPFTYNFGEFRPGNVSVPVLFTVSSIGSSELFVTDIVITGRDFRMFRKVSDSCSGRSLSPGTSATFEIIFAPVSKGCKEAIAQIYTNDLKVPVDRVWLYGRGG